MEWRLDTAPCRGTLVATDCDVRAVEGMPRGAHVTPRVSGETAGLIALFGRVWHP